MRQAHGLEELDAGDCGGAGAVDHEFHVAQRAAGDVEGVDQAGRSDDRGAVLVVVEHRDVHGLAELLLDDEAAGGFDVLEVDPAEGRLEQADAVDEGVDVLGVDLEVDRVDVGEALEQDRLALHHRLGAERAEIAEAEHGGAVRDHRHEVALGGIVVDLGRIGLDREAGCGHARRVGERQVALGRERLGRRDLDLAGPAAAMHLERLVVGDRDVVGLVLDGGAVVRAAHLMVSLTLMGRLLCGGSNRTTVGRTGEREPSSSGESSSNEAVRRQRVRPRHPGQLGAAPGGGDCAPIPDRERWSQGDQLPDRPAASGRHVCRIPIDPHHIRDSYPSAARRSARAARRGSPPCAPASARPSAPPAPRVAPRSGPRPARCRASPCRLSLPPSWPADSDPFIRGLIKSVPCGVATQLL